MNRRAFLGIVPAAVVVVAGVTATSEKPGDAMTLKFMGNLQMGDTVVLAPRHLLRVTRIDYESRTAHLEWVEA
jgi:hypothetical protein